MSSTKTPTLFGAVRLRPPHPEDVAGRLSLGRDADIMRMFGEDPTGLPDITEAGAARWVEGLSAHPCAWIVEHEQRLLGEARLDAINPHDARAQLAVGLYDPAKLGIGLGRDVVRLVLRHGFETLQLHRVSLRVIAFNIRAIRCYSACGFIEEGREREAARIGNEWHDDVIMGILAHQFEPDRR